MTGSGKTIGIILIVVGVVIGIVVLAFMAAGMAQEELTRGGAILGFGLGLVFVLPLVGAGVFLMVKGGREDAEMAQIRKQRRILEMVKTQGKVSISDVVLELKSDRDQVKAWIYDLVGKGLFSGYINWSEGILYSRDATLLKTDKCPNCGGQIELAGKGVSQCPFCGTEIFLS
jgi:hypothetical protein